MIDLKLVEVLNMILISLEVPDEPSRSRIQ